MALGVVDREVKKGKDTFYVDVVPMGITYIQKNVFRSQVLVQFGPALRVNKYYLESIGYDENDESHKGVSELTADMEQRLRALTINAPDFLTLKLLSLARSMYKVRESAHTCSRGVVLNSASIRS